MELLITYLWQSAVVLTLLFIPFQLLLRKEHFFALNRAILLCILMLCLVLPISSHTLPSVVENWLHPAPELIEMPALNLGETKMMDDMTILSNINCY